MNSFIFVCSLSLFTYAAFFGKLPKLGLYVLQILSWLDRSFPTGHIFDSTLQLARSRFVSFEKRPNLLPFFLSFLSGAAILFVPATWLLIPWCHKLALISLLPLPYLFTYLCSTTSPDTRHIISKESHAENISRYSYDYKLFYPNRQCETCKFPKPARSRHCSLCKVCIARADHHCIWVNNCLGRGNYKYFLALLLSTASLLAYTALLAYLTVSPQVKDHFRRFPIQDARLKASLLSNQFRAGEGWWVDHMMLWINRNLDAFNMVLAIGGVARSGVGLLALMTTPLPAGLLAYHVYLIWSGMTTYESRKWKDWKVELADGLGYIAPIVDNDESNQSAHNRWSKSSRRILVLTTDGLPPRNLQPDIKAVVGESAEWRRCRGLREVDNTYDLGPWRNFVELLLD